MNDIQKRPVLPDKGIWTVEDLAKYLGMQNAQLQNALTKNGIKVLHLSSRPRHKIIRLEDLKYNFDVEKSTSF